MTAVLPGVGPASEQIYATQKKAFDDLYTAMVFSKQPVLNELAKVYAARRAPDWDAYGAHPVQVETLLNAWRFVEALPFGYPIPDVGAEPDGHLTLGWYCAANWLLSVSVSSEGMLYYAALLGEEDPRGSCRFCEEIPEIILYLIRRVCIP